MNEFISIFRDLKYMSHYLNVFILEERTGCCSKTKEDREELICTLMIKATTDLIKVIAKEVVKEAPTGKEFLNKDYSDDKLMQSIFKEGIKWEWGANPLIPRDDFKPQYYKAWKEIEELAIKYALFMREDKNEEKNV